MSYDVSFRVKVDGGDDLWVDVGDCDANVTWNVGTIIRLSTGLEWKNEENNGLCSEVIPKICDGLKELELHPNKYKPYEAPNGWGTVNGTIRFFKRILDAWEELIREDERLAALATFWIT